MDQLQPSFKLTVKIASSNVTYFHNKKIRLCCSFGVNSNLLEETYNVIATSDGELSPSCQLLQRRFGSTNLAPEPAETVIVEWTDIYQLAASNEPTPYGCESRPSVIKCAPAG